MTDETIPFFLFSALYKGILGLLSGHHAPCILGANDPLQLEIVPLGKGHTCGHFGLVHFDGLFARGGRKERTSEELRVELRVVGQRVKDERLGATQAVSAKRRT
jgi:hypothetical protein